MWLQCCSIVGNLHRTSVNCSGTLPTMRLRREVWRSLLLWNASSTWTLAELTPPSATGVCLWSRLATGDALLPDKVQAHIHQTWLDYGPTMCSLTRANCAVRQCLSDQGTEFAIADVSDVTHECAYSGKTPSPGQRLYPCAMQVPVTQHILDTILQDSVERWCWWHAWERDAKAVCQRLHKRQT